MADRQEARLSSEGGAPPASGETRSKHGILPLFIALLIVAAIVIAGVLPRVKAKKALDTETKNLAIPTVSVVHPKLGAPQTEIVLPGNVQAFNDSPIYARTNGYLKKWYVDIGARVKGGPVACRHRNPGSGSATRSGARRFEYGAGELQPLGNHRDAVSGIC